MVETIFWLSLTLLIYIYAGYPILLALLSRIKKNAPNKIEFTPSVSILIAAYNEEKDIVATLKNKIQQNYSRNKLEILVVSDESTDATDELIVATASESDIPIRVVRQVPRAGKTSGLNLIVPEAKGEILIFSDANSLWDDDVVARLVKNFSDPEVGYVTGKMVYVDEKGSLIGDGCSAYMKYENWMREKETSIGSVVGVDGGIDAVRAGLYESMRADQLPDFVLPLSVVSKGYRVVYDAEALLKESSLSDANSEYRMRVRVCLRAMWALLDMRHLFNVAKFPLFSWQLLSHKLLRYLAFIPMLLMLISSSLLLGDPLHQTLFIGQLVFYGLAFVGHMTKENSRPLYLSLPYYFVILNIACAHAFLRFMRGEKQAVWNPRVG